MDLNTLKNPDDTVRKNRFIELSHELIKYFKKAEYQISAYHDKSLPHFSALSEAKQNDVLKNLEMYLDIYKMADTDGHCLKDNGHVTWYALKKFGFRFSSDLFKYISDDDVIEIYDSECVQVYRNMKAMGMLSYTLEELISFDWTELFERDDPTKAQAAFEQSMQLFQNPKSGPISMKHLGSHGVRERFSVFHYEYDYMIKDLHPLYNDNGEMTALMAIEDIRLVGPELSPEAKEQLLMARMGTELTIV